MQAHSNNEFFVAVVSGTLIFLLFSCFLIAYILIYRKRRSRHLQQLLEMKLHFEQELLKSKLEIQEQILNHISQEIHDNVGQVLSLAMVEANILSAGETLNRELLSSLKSNISKVIWDLRSMAKSLSSERINMINIHELLSDEADRIRKTGFLDIDFEVRGEIRDIGGQKRLILYRMLQEALQNVIKHSQAKNVIITFKYHEAFLIVTIKDNGNGFDPTDGHASLGLGLHNMRTRALVIGGTCSIEASKQMGTSVEIKVPYE